jgi:hypothetical protein
MNFMNKIITIIALGQKNVKTLGNVKNNKKKKYADIIALREYDIVVRTFIFFTYLITNIAIVANAVRHWNDNDYNRNLIQISRNYS